METNDPALTKTRIADTDAENHVNFDSNTNTILDADAQKGTQTLQETVIGTRYVSDDVDHGEHTHEDIHHNSYNVMSTDADIESHTTTNNHTTNNGADIKSTDTFQESVIDQESVVDSEHVKDGDNPARQPDRRDQEGSAFDEGINEHSVASETPQSEGITDMNRYANIDNAQTRILNPDEKD